MKKLFLILILVSFALPVRAEIAPGFDPVENNLIRKKTLEDEMSKDIQRSTTVATASGQKVEKKGSNWWKWTLGILVVGGVAAAAGGGSKGSDTSSASNPTTSSNPTPGGKGSVTAGW